MKNNEAIYFWGVALIMFESTLAAPCTNCYTGTSGQCFRPDTRQCSPGPCQHWANLCTEDCPSGEYVETGTHPDGRGTCKPVVEPYPSGGMACKLEYECGVAGANWVELLGIDATRGGPRPLSDLSSSRGSCKNGTCECEPNFGCSNCALQKSGSGDTLYTSSQDASIKYELCEQQWGGGACSSDEDCGNGLCLDKKCRCYVDYGCPYCTLTRNDFVAGAKCSVLGSNASSTPASGFGECATAGECNVGKCETRRQRDGTTKSVCICGVGNTCPKCDKKLLDVLAGNESCGCEANACGEHGKCAGNGECDCDYGWGGHKCDVNLCNPDPCENLPHAECNINPSTRQAQCVCKDGYTGDKCDVAPSCRSNADCGLWAPIADAKADPSFACAAASCEENKYGGICITSTGKCQCRGGFTCNTCTAKTLGNSSCEVGTGGGTCTKHSDCQSKNTAEELQQGSANYCFESRCVCQFSFRCPLCQEKVGTDAKCVSQAQTIKDSIPTLMPTAVPTSYPTSYPTSHPASYPTRKDDEVNGTLLNRAHIMLGAGLMCMSILMMFR